LPADDSSPWGHRLLQRRLGQGAKNIALISAFFCGCIFRRASTGTVIEHPVLKYNILKGVETRYAPIPYLSKELKRAKPFPMSRREVQRILNFLASLNSVKRKGMSEHLPWYPSSQASSSCAGKGERTSPRGQRKRCLRRLGRPRKSDSLFKGMPTPVKRRFHCPLYVQRKGYGTPNQPFNL